MSSKGCFYLGLIAVPASFHLVVGWSSLEVMGNLMFGRVTMVSTVS